VLREFRRNDDDTLSEKLRIYIGDDGVTRIASKGTDDNWVPASRRISCWYNSYSYLANKEEAMEKCPRIKYIMKARNVEDHQKEVDFLVNALRFPEIEQMCKLGCGCSAQRIAISNTSKADLKNLFGGYYNDKEKNFLRKIGMTKPQLDVYMRFQGEHENIGYSDREYIAALLYMREMFGNDLSYLDVDSFAKYLSAHKEFRRFRTWGGRFIIDDANLNLDKVRFFKNLVRLREKHENIFTIVADTMEAYRCLEVARRINVDWYFDNVSDAVRAHDVLVELRRIQDAERRALWNMQAAERRKKEEEKRKKLDKERQIYEYEDDQFVIRLPKDATEIAQEGSTQHICIGSYVSRHSMGDTNLFFLRRKSEPDTPFYAIEMNNSKNIIQIHGFGNRWLGNNPEAIPTVVRWLRKHGIKCSDAMLTCAATGYGQTNNYVAMPVVD
jgi:hypothetical protein